MPRDEQDPPPSRPSRTGRHRALSEPNEDWTTGRRQLTKAELQRREDAERRGRTEEQVAQLVHDVGAIERACDVNTAHLPLLAHRLAELEVKVKELNEVTKFVAGVNGVLSTLKVAVPIIIAATAALASGITYILAHSK